MIQGNLDCSYPIHAHKHFVQPRSRTEVVCFSLCYLFFTRLYGHIERCFFFYLFLFFLLFFVVVVFFPPQNRHIFFPTPSPTPSHHDIPISGRRPSSGACSRGIEQVNWISQKDRWNHQTSCSSRWACLQSFPYPFQ